MDFFTSVFSNEPDPSNPPREEEDERGDDAESPGNPNPLDGGGAWSFGGLIKTFASKSESVIQTYRRDLEEFGSGLKKETAAIREAATRAVRDLPVSLETGASVAQESLESVGQAIDDFGGSVWRGTADIISHGKETLLPIDSDASSADPYPDPPAGSSKRYSRFDAQVLAIQSDPATFSDEPEDAEEYQKWKSSFDLAAKEEEIESLCYENGALDVLFEKLAPAVVDYDTFWSRYYYRVHKLKQAEDARANLVKRAILREEEEELSWEVDDDDEEETKEVDTEEIKAEKEQDDRKEEDKEIVGTSEPAEEKKPAELSQVEILEAGSITPDEEPPSMVGNEEPPSMLGEADGDELSGDDLTSKAEDKMPLLEAKADPGESSKNSDFSVVSSQPSMPEEDDLGWDEIEDLGENDHKKVIGSSRSPNRVDLCKKLSATEDDEDLSWDIEDDDEPAKP